MAVALGIKGLFIVKTFLEGAGRSEPPGHENHLDVREFQPPI
jgi:hypothetical protein